MNKNQRIFEVEPGKHYCLVDNDTKGVVVVAGIIIGGVVLGYLAYRKCWNLLKSIEKDVTDVYNHTFGI